MTDDWQDLPAAIRPFWAQFEAVAGVAVRARFQEAFYFDDNEASANELAALVVAGRKRATAGLGWALDGDGRRPAQPGDLNVVTNWHGDPVCVIETRSVETVPYQEVDEEFAAIEGEGDGSLRHWREVHWAFFERECARIGRQPSPDMPVVCERFEVIFRKLQK